MRLTVSFIFVLASFSSSPVFAEKPKVDKHGFAIKDDYSKAKILKDGIINPKDFLPRPPLKGEAEYKRDFETLLTLQKHRTKADCKAAEEVVNVSFRNFFQAPNGPLTKGEADHFNAVLDEVRFDTAHFVKQIKDFYSRPRPFVVNPKIKPCAAKEKSGSYPSGHAAIPRVMAYLLSDWDPARKDAFFKRADDIAQTRLMAGVHHPSDIIAGKLFADRFFPLYLGDEKFLQRWSAVKEGLKLPKH